MIRPTTPDDTTALVAIAESIGFEPNEIGELSKMLADYFSEESNDEESDSDKGNRGDHDHFWLTDDDNGPIGVAYCAPEKMTNGTWNLLFLAVRPDRQGQGHGTALMRYVEQMLTARGARLLLVETLASLHRTRAFYRKCGYEEEAQIRDFYNTGDDKIVYRKVLC